MTRIVVFFPPWSLVITYSHGILFITIFYNKFIIIIAEEPFLWKNFRTSYPHWNFYGCGCLKYLLHWNCFIIFQDCVIIFQDLSKSILCTTTFVIRKFLGMNVSATFVYIILYFWCFKCFPWFISSSPESFSNCFSFKLLQGRRKLCYGGGGGEVGWAKISATIVGQQQKFHNYT